MLGSLSGEHDYPEQFLKVPAGGFPSAVVLLFHFRLTPDIARQSFSEKTRSLSRTGFATEPVLQGSAALQEASEWIAFHREAVRGVPRPIYDRGVQPRTYLESFVIFSVSMGDRCTFSR